MIARASLVLAALLSHWRHRPLQLVMLLAGVMLATALWSGVQAINAEARASYAQAAGQLEAGALERLEPVSGRKLTTDDYVALRRAGWLVSPVVEGRISLGSGGSIHLLGSDPVTRLGMTGAGASDLAAEGDLLGFITPPGIGYGDEETIEALRGADLGGLALQHDDDMPPATLFVDVGVAQTLLGMDDRLSSLILAAHQPEGLPPLEQIAPHLQRLAPGTEADPAALTASFHLNLTAFALLSFAVGLFITQSAVGLAFEQRRSLIRTLRALGVSRTEVLALLAFELLILALLAGAAGVVLGWLMATALMPGVAATLSSLYGADVPGGLALRRGWVLSGLAMAVAGTGLAGAQGMLRMTRMPVLEAAQSTPWLEASRRALRWQAWAAIGLICALPLCLFTGGLIGGLAALGCMLLAAALLLPLVLDTALRWAGQHVRGVLAEWFLADTRQQLGGLSLALMALLLALAANIGVGTMVGSFRATFTGWLDQRLVAELYIDARDEAEAGAITAWLVPRADAVLPDLRVAARLDARPGQIRGLPDDPTFRDHWPLLSAQSGAWDALAAGEGVLINEQLHYQAGLRLGDRLELPGGALPVLGIYSDYGNPAPQAVIGADSFRHRFPEIAATHLAVRVAPDEAASLAQALRAQFDLPPGAVTDQARAKAAAMRIFERTFAVTAALNVLTLAVAGIALLTGLLTLATLRLPQLAPVWATGLPRSRLSWAELGRTVALAGAVAVCAVPLGLALAWMLLAMVNVEAFGWRLPMQIAPGLIGWTGLAALLTALAAGAWPALRLARMTPARLLRIFADER